MADNTVADLPTKNAAPAEPAKSLAATVQQVMTKAVTSPTDAKVDFAQGVNHITGDPQQKSAGAADAMQSLKAEADPKKSYSNANEAEEKKDKEKEDMKEVADKEDEKKKDEMMKASKDKEDMKEGEMPAGLKKYLDKKSDKSENKEDEKKDVKETADEDEKKDKKEMMKASKDKEDMKEGEMPKAALDALNKSKDKEVKEVADKDDEKKKEVSEVADKEKEVKKETAKDKVKDMDMKEDVAALTEGEDLSEEFKAKAATIFEASIKAKLVEEIENLESEYETKVNEKVEETKSEIVEKVDAYLNYVVEEWMKENELAIEKGLRAEITEDFIGGLKSLFESHYINVPQEKYDVIEAQTAEIEKLKEEVNSTIEKNVELNQAIGQHVRTDIINDVTSDLAETETEKLKGLAEGIEYKDAESFRASVETLKNSYYPKAKASDTESNEVAENNAGSMNESMAAYTAAISKSKKNPYVK
jgi:hypothetical protein|tara:strand:+ start:1746 stop:3170 length:1425 start_codon:yes stop_codon:yes gene_type:complete